MSQSLLPSLFKTFHKPVPTGFQVAVKPQLNVGDLGHVPRLVGRDTIERVQWDLQVGEELLHFVRC